MGRLAPQDVARRFLSGAGGEDDQPLVALLDLGPALDESGTVFDGVLDARLGAEEGRAELDHQLLATVDRRTEGDQGMQLPAVQALGMAGAV